MPKTTTNSSSIGTRSSFGCISDKRRTVLRITLAAFAVLLVFSLAAAPASAVEYSSWENWATENGITGDGNSEGNAYQIGNLDQFVSFRDTVNSIGSTSGKFFKVTEDIYLESVCGVVIGSWYPIGTSSSEAFKGTFDGNSKTISGLYMSYNSLDGTNWGLFGYTDGATIKNLGLIGEKVIGKDNVGGLVGKNMGGNITNCYATGSVSGKNYVGGLVGWNSGNITYCYATGSVYDGATGPHTGTKFGGLVGYNSGNITDCYATGAVEGKDNLGGLVGLNRFDGKIENCYATGAVTGEDSGYVGGLVGENRGKIENCYATGTVTGDHYIGGLAGGNYAISAILQNSVALNRYVSGNTDVGRVVGVSQSGDNIGKIENCYAWKDMTDRNTGSLLLSGSSDNKGADATSDQVWANPDFYKTTLGWDISTDGTTVWKITTNLDDGWGIPYLSTIGKPSDSSSIQYLKPQTVTCIITATAQTGGTISPNGEISVQKGSSVVFTITADSGYKISDVKVNEISQGAKTSYTFTNVRAESTIEALFEKIVTPNPQSGGSTDTGSGHFTNYPRTVTDGGHVSFGTSPIVTGVDMPEGVTGSVELITVVVTDTDGREHYATFEINAPKSADGEKSLIYFQLDLKKIEADGYTVKDVVLSHKNEDGTWTDLKTTYLGTKDGKAKYSAENTVGYSVFAIYYTDGASIEDTEPEVTAVKTQTPEPEQTYVEPTMPATAVPTPEQTKSPVGLVGLGLGLLGAFAALRRK